MAGSVKPTPPTSPQVRFSSITTTMWRYLTGGAAGDPQVDRSAAAVTGDVLDVAVLDESFAERPELPQPATATTATATSRAIDGLDVGSAEGRTTTSIDHERMSRCRLRGRRAPTKS